MKIHHHDFIKSIRDTLDNKQYFMLLKFENSR